MGGNASSPGGALLARYESIHRAYLHSRTKNLTEALPANEHGGRLKVWELRVPADPSGLGARLQRADQFGRQLEFARQVLQVGVLLLVLIINDRQRDQINLGRRRR